MSNALLSLQEAADRLDVHYMTVYRYVRTGRLPAEKRGGEWRIESAALDQLQQAPPPPPPRSRRAPWAGRLAARLLAGDRAGAWSVVESAMAAGASPTSVYLDVIVPAMRDIGDRWVRGAIDIADEHQATALVTGILGRLSPRFGRPGRSRGTVLVGTAPGELHALGVSMVCDLLREAGYEAVDLGCNIPIESFVTAVERADRLVAVAVSAGSADNEPQVRSLIDALRRAASGVPVLLGGAAVPNRESAVALGADGWAASAADVSGLITKLR